MMIHGTDDDSNLTSIAAHDAINNISVKISFSEEDPTPAAPVVYGVGNMEQDTIPAWIKAVLDKQKTM